MEITTKLDDAIRDANYLGDECTDEGLADLIQVHITNLEAVRDSVAQHMPGACLVPSAMRNIEERKAAMKGRLKNPPPDRWTCEQSEAFAREHLSQNWKSSAEIATDLTCKIEDVEERAAWEQFYRGHLDRVWKRWHEEAEIIDEKFVVLHRKKTGHGFSQQYRLDALVAV